MQSWERLHSPLAHLKLFQVLGKLGLLGLLNVHVLRQLDRAQLVVTFLGLLLGGWRSHGLQHRVQHLELQNTKMVREHALGGPDAHRE